MKGENGMSEQTILDNTQKERTDDDSLWPNEVDEITGLGCQFRLFIDAVVSRVRFRLRRRLLGQ
jgi:hypothetical protein